MTTALEGYEGSASRPCRSLLPGKTRYPLYRRLGGPHGRSGGQVRKISPPPGFDPRSVKPLASRYTDYATRPTIKPKGNVCILYSYISFVIFTRNKYCEFWQSGASNDGKTEDYHYTPQVSVPIIFILSIAEYWMGYFEIACNDIHI